MPTARMNLDEIITSAKNRTYTKRLSVVVILFLIIVSPLFFTNGYGSVSPTLKVFFGLTFSALMVAVAGCFIKWGDYITEERLGRKIKDMSIGELKSFYKSYGITPSSEKRVDEKITIEQIMIDLALHFRNQGDFAEPLKSYETKGINHKSDNQYSFVAKKEEISLDEKVNKYILDTFFSTQFLDDVRLDSIKF